MPLRDFRRVLVANRGEIAVRVARGLSELGLATVAVYSEADRAALHVRRADRAICIGPPDPRASYLDFDRILAAAKDTACDAVHPGYGFLSENAAFARACREAGLVFIGPTPESMEAIGGKKPAKAVAASAGVPVVPGYDGGDQGDAAFRAAAAKIGFPLLVKASAGGGGKGMRKVDRAADLDEALASARREAASAFGDDVLVLEKWIHPARHVEIQILGDASGAVLHLNERECSIQRRHQKVIEEAPSPAVAPALREAMGKAAVALARAARYENAGTVEFLVDSGGRFYFLEVNARLQVEHTVTELTTGLDLVHLQVKIARGEKLADLLPSGPPAPRGHALQARICAEDPDAGFLPAAGRIRFVCEPEGPGVRVDSGVYSGCEVPVHYDSLIAKIITHAPDRATCIARMERALKEAAYLGLPTNTDYLRRILGTEAFRKGDLRTDFVELHAGELTPAAEVPDEALIAAALAAHLQGTGQRGPERDGATRSDPWRTLGPLRLPGRA